MKFVAPMTLTIERGLTRDADSSDASQGSIGCMRVEQNRRISQTHSRNCPLSGGLCLIGVIMFSPSSTCRTARGRLVCMERIESVSPVALQISQAYFSEVGGMIEPRPCTSLRDAAGKNDRLYPPGTQVAQTHVLEPRYCLLAFAHHGVITHWNQS